MTAPDQAWVEAGERALVSQHWDGEGCGTHGTNGCSNCCGPSPMTAREVAEAVITEVAPLIRADERERNTPLDIEAYRVALTRNLRDQIANDIDALHSEYDPSGSGERWHACMDQREHGLLERCAAIARNEVGNDEQTS